MTIGIITKLVNTSKEIAYNLSERITVIELDKKRIKNSLIRNIYRIKESILILEKEKPDGGFDSSSSGKSDGQGDLRPGENMNFDPRSRELSGNPTGTSDTTKWILVGVSALVLAAGLFVAAKSFQTLND